MPKFLKLMSQRRRVQFEVRQVWQAQTKRLKAIKKQSKCPRTHGPAHMHTPVHTRPPHSCRHLCIPAHTRTHPCTPAHTCAYPCTTSHTHAIQCMAVHTRSQLCTPAPVRHTSANPPHRHTPAYTHDYTQGNPQEPSKPQKTQKS